MGEFLPLTSLPQCGSAAPLEMPVFLSRFRSALCFLLLLPASALADDKEGMEFFESKIRPVLVQHCYECHSTDSKPLKAGLRVDTREAMRKGGESGPAVSPSSVAESLVVSALKYDGFEMPPSGRLPDHVIKDFETWIEMGAPDPREGEAVVAEPAIDFESAAKFWSFQRPMKCDLPPTVDTAWPKNEIDSFVLNKLERESLHPVPAAGKRELIRRATFDLLGLPPSPKEVSDFLADESPDAYARLVDRLLASPHYGERWGRYWLDVARYADDQAHTFGVRPNSDAWRYRQWVIESLNADMPYDQFVRLQIAGDQLDEGAKYDRLVALGYFGLGAVYYKNSDKAKAQADELDDRVDTLTRGFLGLTVSCARCHDHKFDPIPTSDYYSLAGIFNSSPLTNVPLVEPGVVDAYNLGQKNLKDAEKQVNERTRSLREDIAERSVDQVSQYVIAVWKQRVAESRKQPLSNLELAKATGLNEVAIQKWANFLSVANRDKYESLAAWHALPQPSAETSMDEVPEAVQRVADEFQAILKSTLDERDGKPVQQAPVVKNRSEPLFASPLIDKNRASVQIDVELGGARQLYLVITDAEDGKSCDHADWIEPTLVTATGEQKLTDLKWRSAKTGHGSINLNRGVTGQPLRIGNQEYKNGIGTHAPCVIAYDLPEGVKRFRATAGLDVSGTEQGSGATVKFLVYTTPPPATLTVDSDESSPQVGSSKLSKSQVELLKGVFGDGGLFRQSDEELQRSLTEAEVTELKKLQAQFEAAKQSAPAMYPTAHAIHDRNPQDMKVFLRGNPAREGDVAPRQFLRVLAGADRSPYDSGSGRLGLANDIASDQNPLTARVIVNRVWQQHFGRGIVGTPSNFGHLGEVPTHPELLDWLAVDFMEHGWSLKWLHRKIMLSATYQLSSQYDATNANIDGDARFLWRMNRRRLDVEAWRDALLVVSGNLDTTVGGENAPLTGNRRTVYTKVSRHDLDELLRLFDFPDANVTSAKRTVTTVPQQQLFVLNSEFFVRQAQAFGKRVQAEAKSETQRIELAFSLLFSRSPTEQELKVGLDFLATANDAPQEKLNAWQQYAQALLSLNEFMYID